MKKLQSLIPCLVFFVMTLPLWTSCSDDDETPTLNVSEELSQKGISTDLKGGLFTIPVTGDAAWTASLPKDCKWAMLLQESKEGQGDGEVKLYVGQNLTGATRKTELTLATASQKIIISVKQNETVNGQAPGNAGHAYIQLAATKGVGVGCDLNDFYDTEMEIFKLKEPIVNMEMVEELMNAGKAYGSIYRENKINQIKATDVNIDSVEVKSDTLGISLSLQIAYGTFKFGLSGGYHSSEERVSNAKQFKTAGNYPRMTNTLSYATLLGLIRNIKENTPNADILQCLLTPGFQYYREALAEACADDSNSSETQQLMAEIVDVFGTGVMIGSTLGGMYALEFYADSVYVKEKMGIEDAKVTAKISAGLFSLDANVDATYTKQATEILQHSTCSCLIKGGSMSKMQAVLDDFQSKNYGNLREKSVSEWANSIQLSEDPYESNVELLDANIVPIWNFFTGTSQKVLKEYVRKNDELLKKYAQ